MDYITMTDLRTKSKELAKTLHEGFSVDLIHRSKVIGEIRPKMYDPKPFDPDKFLNTLKKLKNVSNLSYKEREKRYRKHLEKKYGKSIS